MDVQPVGEMGTDIGFASVNTAFHGFTGVHMGLYYLTDALSIIPLGFVVGFGILGVVQWLCRKNLKSVDRSLIVMGIFYVAVFAVYALFEVVDINYRPVLIDGNLEGSYPSSTTMLAMCVLPTAALQLKKRIKTVWIGKLVTAALYAFTAFMVIGRLISGVHWITDIIGGLLVSAGLVFLYDALK